MQVATTVYKYMVKLLIIYVYVYLLEKLSSSFKSVGSGVKLSWNKRNIKLILFKKSINIICNLMRGTRAVCNDGD